MTAVHLKNAPQAAAVHDASTAKTVGDMLADIEAGGEAAVRRYSASLDDWSPDSFVLSREDLAHAAASVPAGIRADIDFSLDRVQAFAAAQRWRRRAEHPLNDPFTTRACRAAVRSAEGLVAQFTARGY